MPPLPLHKLEFNVCSFSFQEKTANVTKSASNSPVLARNQNGGIHQLDATSKSATINGGLPQATLDLSGPNSRVLELSTLV